MLSGDPLALERVVTVIGGDAVDHAAFGIRVDGKDMRDIGAGRAGRVAQRALADGSAT